MRVLQREIRTCWQCPYCQARQEPFQGMMWVCAVRGRGRRLKGEITKGVDKWCPLPEKEAGRAGITVN